MQDTNPGAAPRRSPFEKGALWALTATLVLVSVIAIPIASVPFLATKGTVLALGVIVTLVLFILARLMRGNLAIPHPVLLGSLWLVPLAYLFSTLFSGVRYETAFFGVGFSADTFGLMLILALLGTLASLMLATRNAQSFFLKGLGLAFGLILLSEVVFIVLGVLAPSVIAPTSSLLGSFIDLGAFMGLVVTMILITMRFYPQRGLVKKGLIAALIVALIVLALVNSLVDWALVAIVAFAFFVEAIMYRKQAQAQESRPLILPLVTLAAGILFILGNSTLGASLGSLMGTSYIDARPSWQSTFGIGTHTYASSPLFGSGPGSFMQEWVQHHDRAVNDSIFWSIDFGSGVGHVPTSFVTTGLLGVLAWIAFFGLFLFFGLRALFTRMPQDAWGRYVSIASFAGAVYVFALMVLALPSVVTMAIGFALAGLFTASLTREGERVFVFSQNPRVGFALVFLLTLLLLASVAAAYVVIERYVAALSYGQASASMAQGDIDRAERAIAHSISLSPTDEYYRAAALIGLARMNQIANNAELPTEAAQEQFREAVTRAIENGIQATTIDPSNYQNWTVLGNIYGSLVTLGVNGAYENAIGAYERATALAPTNAVLPFILAQLEIANRNIPAAEARLIEAINLKRDYTQAILLFARVEVESGKTAEALQAAEAAAYFSPNDPGVLLQVGLLRSAAGDRPGAIQALASAVAQNPQYANARFFLGVMYAITGDYARAVTELEAVASFSEENAQAVAADLAALREGRNPFPNSRLAAFGITYAPVDEPALPGIPQN